MRIEKRVKLTLRYRYVLIYWPAALPALLIYCTRSSRTRTSGAMMAEMLLICMTVDKA